MLGLGAHETTLSESDWLAHVHPEDRGVFRAALQQVGTGQGFRLEFRVPQGSYIRWLELRASVNRLDDAADMLGLLSDITARKEEEASRAHPPPVDPLTGLGNRVALMAALEGPPFPGGLLALLDLDRFKSIHASIGDSGGDLVLRGTAERLVHRFGQEAQDFPGGRRRLCAAVRQDKAGAPGAGRGDGGAVQPAAYPAGPQHFRARQRRHARFPPKTRWP